MTKNIFIRSNPKNDLGLKILLVDDHALNRFMIQTILEKWNCSITIAEDGLEAISKIIRQHFDLILMDMRMPVMDGRTASEFIRKRLKKETPIIAITSDSIQYGNIKLEECGIDDFISKPFSQDELYQKVINILENKRGEAVTERLMDLDKMRSQSNNDENFMLKMIELFLEDTQEKIASIQRATDNLEMDLLSDIAHKMKPSLHFLADASVVETAARIEAKTDPETHLLFAESLWFIDQLTSLTSELNSFVASMKVNDK